MIEIVNMKCACNSSMNEHVCTTIQNSHISVPRQVSPNVKTQLYMLFTQEYLQRVTEYLQNIN